MERRDMNIPLGYPNLLRSRPVLVFASLGVFIGASVAPRLADLELPVLWVVVASTILAVSAGTYLLENASFERAVHLMILTLPMLSALVIDVGGAIRIMIYHRRSWLAMFMYVRFGLLAGRPFRSVSDVIASHVESVGTKALTRAEARQLFAAFSQV